MKPYEIVGELKRFDRRNVAFARSHSQADHPARRAKRRTVEELIASGKEGFGRADFALQAGSRVVDGSLRGQFGQVQTPPEGVAPWQPADAAKLTARVKEAAELFGAADVGVTRVNPLWVYTAGEGEGESPVLTAGLTTAVVMTIEMDYDLIATSPGVGASAATGVGYSQMAATAVSVAGMLVSLGFSALPSGNDAALSVPLAIDAGLGEAGRNGNLIARRHGPRVRLCKVFTDAPLATDEPIDLGVRATCGGCEKCADACPVGAIPRGEPTAAGPTPSNNPGPVKWYANPDKCLAFWAVNGTSCSNCIRSCPFNRPPS